MEEITLFTGISEQEREKMMTCFSARTRAFDAQETIMSYTGEAERIAVLLSGKAQVVCLDEEGRMSLLENVQPEEVFGEVFCPGSPGVSCMVQALTPCQVMFIPYPRIITCCANVCPHHSRLINNLFRLTAHKAQALAFRVNLLSQRTVRLRILCYLEHQSALTGSDEFTLPMKLVQLADYLCVDRSAMMREIRRLKDEGVLASAGRRFHMLSRP